MSRLQLQQKSVLMPASLPSTASSSYEVSVVLPGTGSIKVMFIKGPEMRQLTEGTK